MFELIQLIILFFVLFDPFASLAAFFAATELMSHSEKKRVAFYAILVAGLLSFGTLLFGEKLLVLFHTNISDFRIAGGLILIILGVRMSLGYALTNIDNSRKERSIHAIAALIATPLLTGPAVMTATIVLKYDYGISLTAMALIAVLSVTWMMFNNSQKIYNLFGKETIKVITTFFGLITISWGIGFLRAAIGF